MSVPQIAVLAIDQHIVRPPRLGNIRQPDAGCGLLFHGCFRGFVFFLDFGPAIFSERPAARGRRA
jgi:hypothetical protein